MHIRKYQTQSIIFGSLFYSVVLGETSEDLEKPQSQNKSDEFKLETEPHETDLGDYCCSQFLFQIRNRASQDWPSWFLSLTIPFS